MNNQFVGEISENVDKEKTWEWARNSDLKVRGNIFVEQEKVIKTNTKKCNTDRTMDTG